MDFDFIMFMCVCVCVLLLCSYVIALYIPLGLFNDWIDKVYCSDFSITISEIIIKYNNISVYICIHYLI